MTSAIFPSPTKTWHTTAYPSIDPSLPKLSTEGKLVVITGGGSGIGPSIARAFAKAGASDIGIIGRTESTLAATKQAIEAQFPAVAVHVAVADVTLKDTIDAAFSKIQSLSGGRAVDICVSNAGYLPDIVPTRDADIAEWWSGYEINVKGSLIVTQAFLRVAASENAVLISVSAGAAHMPVTQLPGWSAYVSSKLAAVKVFEYVQAENPGLRVMSVHPGIVASDMSAKTAREGVKFIFDDGEALLSPL
jgi:NAD(P)-dependent dehydrogenase (short-subunit alcohol dehydrogenase family)